MVTDVGDGGGIEVGGGSHVYVVIVMWLGNDGRALVVMGVTATIVDLVMTVVMIAKL